MSCIWIILLPTIGLLLTLYLLTQTFSQTLRLRKERNTAGGRLLHEWVHAQALVQPRTVSKDSRQTCLEEQSERHVVVSTTTKTTTTTTTGQSQTADSAPGAATWKVTLSTRHFLVAIHIYRDVMCKHAHCGLLALTVRSSPERPLPATGIPACQAQSCL